MAVFLITPATASPTVAGGAYNTASGPSAAIGGGNNNQANNTVTTIPGGLQAAAVNYGQLAYASGAFATPGDAQHSVYVLRNTTAWSNNVVNLYLDGFSQEIALPTNRACAFSVSLVGFSSTHTCYGFHLRGVADGNSNVEDDWNNDPASVGYVFYPEAYQYTPGFNPISIGTNPTVSVSGGYLHVHVTGTTTDVIRWVATVETTEVSF